MIFLWGQRSQFTPLFDFEAFYLFVFLQVIKCRNEIMHSSEMKVSSTWLRDFQMKIQNFLNEFRNIPEIVAVYSRIEQVKIMFNSSGIQNEGTENNNSHTFRI